MKKINENKMMYATLASILLLGAFILPTWSPIIAQQPSQPDIDSLILQVPLLSPADEAKATQIAESNSAVQKMINGRTHSVMSIARVGNLYATPITSYPDIHFNVGNATHIEVVVDLHSTSVLSVTETPLIKVQLPTQELSVQQLPGSSTHSFAIDNINNVPTAFNGMWMLYTAPTYGTSGANKFSSFLVNAVEPNANDAFSCNSGHVADSYFAQAGTSFDITAAHIIYAETGSSCLENIVSFVPYIAGHLYKSRVYTTITTPKTWNMSVTDLNNGNFFVFSRGGQNFYTFQQNAATSVFLENANTVTTWKNQFGSTTLSAQAKYSTDNGSTWINWPGDGHTLQDCHVPPSTATVITGDLISGHTATWNLANMPLGC